jgi:hypothetical protein
MHKVTFYRQQKGGGRYLDWYPQPGYINTTEIETAQLSWYPTMPAEPVTEVVMKSGEKHIVDGELIFDESGKLVAHHPGKKR